MTPLGFISGNAAVQSTTPSSDSGEGRVGVYAVLGGTTGAIPLPWVPRAVLRRVRGAMLHDLAASRGLSLTREAHETLSDPRGPKPTRRLAMRALGIVADGLARRSLAALGPARLVHPLRGATQTYILGHLFDRYLRLRRTESGHVMGADEASHLRSAIDGALVRAILGGAGDRGRGDDRDDVVDPAADFLDRLLQRIVRVPERLTRRLDTAFDELIEHDHR